MARAICPEVRATRFSPPNPVKYASSLNRTQAQVDSDGVMRFVISHRDPGVANWLATGGAERGYLMIRWQGVLTPLAPADQPHAVRVRLSDLDVHLPANTARVTEEQRATLLSLRAQLPALKQE